MQCEIHKDYFEDTCDACHNEYLEMKGVGSSGELKNGKKYKDLTEERAKKLYEELMLQYLKSGHSEQDADGKAKAILRKQCSIRGIAFWPWL